MIGSQESYDDSIQSACEHTITHTHIHTHIHNTPVVQLKALPLELPR
jgi:hypothetical protein